ncbi:MAG: hypothetical protein EBS79_04490 [Gammaproteobacteria bacterium]|nr:hypothetical protein [Gammaproteobacteria bacterium]NBY22425.1 hypothetical protein [Gammaproteobacteria bacterium]
MGVTPMRTKKFSEDRPRETERSHSQKCAKTDLTNRWVNVRPLHPAAIVSEAQQPIAHPNAKATRPKDKITMKQINAVLRQAKNYEGKLEGGLPTTKANRAGIREFVR